MSKAHYSLYITDFWEGMIFVVSFKKCVCMYVCVTLIFNSTKIAKSIIVLRYLPSSKYTIN